ncbi:MAG: sulfotransferase [Flavobacteriaceae bacterium]
MKKFKVITGFFWWWWYLISYLKGLQLKNDFASVKKYIFFIGYPRSGHSLIGSLLDAHPEMVISNELNSLHFFQKNYFRHQIFYFILKNSKNHANAGRSNSDYNYIVPEQWQGSYTNIEYIGDKKGGKSSAILGENNYLDLLNKIEKISRAKLKIIHVIRNPFDNVSTMIMRQVNKNGEQLSEELVEKKIALYLSKAKTNSKIKSAKPNEVCDVHLENFISNPKEELQRICSFLEIDVTDKYIRDCVSIVWNKPNPSRFTMPLWTSERLENFYNSIQKYDFLKKYKY